MNPSIFNLPSSIHISLPCFRTLRTYTVNIKERKQSHCDINLITNITDNLIWLVLCWTPKPRACLPYPKYTSKSHIFDLPPSIGDSLLCLRTPRNHTIDSESVSRETTAIDPVCERRGLYTWPLRNRGPASTAHVVEATGGLWRKQPHGCDVDWWVEMEL